MKKFFLLNTLLISFLLISLNALAQVEGSEVVTEKTTVKITKKEQPALATYTLSKPLNILKFKITNAPVLCYERQMMPNQSLQIGVKLPFGFGIVTTPPNWYVESEYRFYFLHKTHLTSFFAAPYLCYASETKDEMQRASDPLVYEVYQSLHLGAKVGYQLRIGKIFNIDTWFGHEATMFANNVSDHAPQNNFAYSIPLNNWLYGISCGIAF